MRILLDAQLSHEIASELVRRGIDAEAVTSREDLAGNTPDEQLMTLAHAEDRVIVTNNIKDFRPIAARRLLRGQGHAGLILVSPATPRTRAAVRPLADAIERLAREYPGGLADGERWI